MRRRHLVLAVCALMAMATPASAYLLLSTTIAGGVMSIKWGRSPVRKGN